MTSVEIGQPRPPLAVQGNAVTVTPCELCKRPLKKGDPVAWWEVPHRDGGTRRTAYHSDCHHANVKHGKPIR